MKHLAHAPTVAFQDELPYSCWPSKLEYDAARGRFVLLYNSNSDHIGTGGVSAVLCRFFDPSLMKWSAPVTVGSIPGNYVESNGLIIMPNGDYVAPVACRSNNGLGGVLTGRIYKSTDGGLTWTFAPLQESGFGSTSPLCISHASLLPSGAWLMYVSLTGLTQLYKWDGLSQNYDVWLKIQVIDRTAVGNPTFANEGRFYQVGNDVVCIARRNVDGVYTSPMRPMFTKSSDGGATWTAWQYCLQPSVEMTNGNMCWIDNGDGTHDCIWSSRLNTRINRLGHLYKATVSNDDLVNARLSGIEPIAYGPPTRDFGYPGAARTDDDTLRLVTWYAPDESDGRVKIWQRVEVAIQDQRNPDYVPGGHVRRITSGTRT